MPKPTARSNASLATKAQPAAVPRVRANPKPSARHPMKTGTASQLTSRAEPARKTPSSALLTTATVSPPRATKGR
jgi:hypothetical protein